MAATPTLDKRIESLFADLDAAVRARGPTCWTSGKCCKFDEYGHRLYVTGLEIAWVLRRLELSGETKTQSVAATGGRSLPIVGTKPSGGACRYQVDGLCGIHAVRPMGCRVFFCQEGTSEWQHELYERFLKELRDIHDANRIEYRYMEWRAGLAEAAEY